MTMLFLSPNQECQSSEGNYLLHLDYGEDATVLLNGVTRTGSVPQKNAWFFSLHLTGPSPSPRKVNEYNNSIFQSNGVLLHCQSSTSCWLNLFNLVISIPSSCWWLRDLVVILWRFSKWWTRYLYRFSCKTNMSLKGETTNYRQMQHLFAYTINRHVIYPHQVHDQLTFCHW